MTSTKFLAAGATPLYCRVLERITMALRERRMARLEKQEKAERAAIAKVFNNRYTYRVRLLESANHLEGCRKGNAWMCPECNQIYQPYATSIWSGLQYPGCCSTGYGHRLDAKIRTK